MNINKILIFLIFVSLISCIKTKDSIEIYLLKERIKSKEGISISEIKKNSKIDYITDIKSAAKVANYDTVKKEFIYAGQFEVDSNYLNDKPLINNAEIINLNLKNGSIQFSESGIEKIAKLKISVQHGTQFAICVNKKPLLTGYFWNFYSSYGSTWNCIESNNPKIKDQLKIYRGNGIDATKKISVNFDNSQELIKAFRITNRLIE